LIAAAAIPDLPEVAPGDDLGSLLRPHVGDGDVLVLAHKVVSKAEGRIVDLAEVVVGGEATQMAVEHGKDPRHMQAILDETAEIVRTRPGVLICRTRHGFVCANAGVDTSNAPPGHVILLPRDPDASARALRHALHPVRCAVVIADSFGRAWRVGQADTAIGIAGLAPVDDWRGRKDRSGLELQATVLAIADEAAAAADLARRGKDSGQPAVVIRGLDRFLTEEDGPGAAALVRERADDLFS
jgi:coenzyme F420-0:L-glutamate ligase / coenzyme F420-1:gamma-L-glutamate ligase